MKYALKLAALSAMIFMGGCTSTHQMNPTPDQQSTSKVSYAEAEFNKERLIQEAYEKGLKVGVSKGHDQAIEIITKEYLPYIKRMEAGKYVIRKGFITAPEVMIYQNNNGTLNYRTTGCKIEKELDVQDIFKRFGKDVIVESGQTKPENAFSESGNVSSGDAYHIAYRDETLPSVLRPGYKDESMVKSINKTTSNKLVLDEYNVRYSEKENAYIAVFSTKEEMEGFCSQFRICSKD